MTRLNSNNFQRNRDFSPVLFWNRDFSPVKANEPKGSTPIEERWVYPLYSLQELFRTALGRSGDLPLPA